MSGLNRVMLIGRLGRDPEMRRTGAGDPVVNFSIATLETWRDKATGERKERTEWHNVVIFNEHLCDVAEKYLKKGSQCYVSGKMATREYTDRDGNQRKTTEVVLQRFNGELVLLGDPGGTSGARADESSYGKESTKTYASEKGRVETGGSGRMGEAIDDSIPF